MSPAKLRTTSRVEAAAMAKRERRCAVRRLNDALSRAGRAHYVDRRTGVLNGVFNPRTRSYIYPPGAPIWRLGFYVPPWKRAR